jgi:nitrite reductase/ring-hydroxylating ferredoxin subunit
MTRIIPLCPVESIAEPGSRAFALGELEGFIVRKDGEIRAYRDSCPHTGVPLAWPPGGHLDADGALIQCAMHGALFLPDTGECVHGPCVGRFLEPLPVRVAQGVVELLADARLAEELDED